MTSHESTEPEPSPRAGRPSLAQVFQNTPYAVLLVLSATGLVVFGMLLNQALAQFQAAEDLRSRIFVIWPTLLGIGLWGWMLIERSFVRSDPTIDIVFRRAGVLGLGIVLCRDLDPGIILAAIAGYAICGVRTRFLLTLSAVTALVLFPVLQGWLRPEGFLGEIGVRDFAGDTLHVLAGMIGIVVLTGSRWSNREPLPREEMRPDRLSSAIAGFILIQVAFASIFGREAYGESYLLARTVLLNGLVAALCGGAVGWIIHSRIDLRPRIHLILFGNMAGWVVTAAGANHYTIWQSALFGAMAALLMAGVLALLDTLELRDPFALVPIHFACGALGLLLVPAGAGSGANVIIQLVAVLAISIPAFVVGCLVVFPFVKFRMLSKHDPGKAPA